MEKYGKSSNVFVANTAEFGKYRMGGYGHIEVYMRMF